MELSIQNLKQDALQDRLSSGGVNISMLWVCTKRFPRKSSFSSPSSTTQTGVIVDADLRLAHGTSVTMQELANEDWVVRGRKAASSRFWDGVHGLPSWFSSRWQPCSEGRPGRDHRMSRGMLYRSCALTLPPHPTAGGKVKKSGFIKAQIKNGFHAVAQAERPWELVLYFNLSDNLQFLVFVEVAGAGWDSREL
ncbi:hypothetical protein J2X01_002621 [Arthrobacter ginsengisoli]|uniref:Uncharacterized protein n=2 Tax=Arthrobacter ginsengisoli TaxID=1356565 RepID=A0ABU1UDS1_9MICC|nr:hypothetical protein [Arthrobacter ginsengisoli]